MNNRDIWENTVSLLFVFLYFKGKKTLFWNVWKPVVPEINT